MLASVSSFKFTRFSINSRLRNWPTVKEARGKFLFILDKVGKTRDLYIGDTKSLRGKLLFTNSPAGSPESATLILNESDDPLIPQRVKEGYIVRTRADANTLEARTHDYTKFNNAKKSGAHLISTDYYLPSKLFPSTFKVFLRTDPTKEHIQSLKKRSKKELIFMRFSSNFQNKK